MSKYTTGDLAKLCDVSVRTVQFYDSKGLLKPSELSEGGRRVYHEEELSKLNMICLLKKLGLSLDAIKGIMESANSAKILMLLLDEQEKHIDNEIANMQKQIKAIEIVKENIRNQKTISVNSINDIELILDGKKKLKRTHIFMVVISIIMAIIEYGTLYLWIFKGHWRPFAIGMPMVFVLAAILLRVYYTNTAYICPECNHKFRPKFGEFTFAMHTPKTRKLVCPECGKKEYCIETYSD